MKIRTIYQKVQNLKTAKAFWESLLEIVPAKDSANWCEFQLDNLNFALLLNDFGDEFKGSNTVPVFELAKNDVKKFVQKAKNLGAVIVMDGLSNPNMQSIVLKDPSGNEFELSQIHV